jgi:hypothetical protein
MRVKDVGAMFYLFIFFFSKSSRFQPGKDMSDKG